MANKILVLTVDRDDDLGRKTGIKGPVIGREAVLSAASKLGLADPEDSDFNAMFEAIRVYEEVKKTNKAEVAILTGDNDVGLKSDSIVADQLKKVLKSFKADGVFLVTDGAEDDHTIPIIQSQIPIVSVKRLVVKQAEQLESAYFKIKDFIEESIKEPKIARTIFGIPAIILLLLGIFGTEGGRIVIFLLGAYLLIKGFRLEGIFTGSFDELRTSFTRRRLGFFVYIVAIIIGLLSIYRGYTYALDWLPTSIFHVVAGFFSSSVYLLWITATVAWFGRLLTHAHRHTKGTLVAGPLFGFAISLVVFSATEIVLKPAYNIFNFILVVIVGFILIGIAVYLEKYTGQKKHKEKKAKESKKTKRKK